MTPAVPQELLARASSWDALKRWERRELGQELRRLGLSYREISQIIPVHKGTLSGWCRPVALTAEKQIRISALRPAVVTRMTIGEIHRQRAQVRRDAVREKGRVEGFSLATDPLWAAGTVAYWSEGGKVSGRVQFANSDPALIRLFVRWYERFLGGPPSSMAAQLHLHSGQDEDERVAFWSGVTGIPPERFTKTFWKKEGTGHRKQLLYNGTASIRPSRSGDNLQRILGWIDALKEIWGR